MNTKRTALDLSLIGRMLLLAAASLASFAQTSAPPPSPSSVFEVAAIKQNKSDSGGSHSDTNNGRFTATNTSLRSLMQYEAYGIPGNRIVGGPKWLDSTKFDIEAKMDDSVADHLRTLAHSQEELETQAMFRQLLADRFKLAVHWEARDLPIYALMVAKKGPKLQPTKEAYSGTSSSDSQSGSQFNAKGVTLPQLAEALTRVLFRELGRDIVDRTGIEGRYDLDLKWTPETGSATDAEVSSANVGPSIFTAIQEQLGLRLEPAKGPVQILVIDHAEMPSED